MVVYNEVLQKNREILKEGSSLILTLIKSNSEEENRFRRTNVQKIASLSELLNKPIEEVIPKINPTIEFFSLFPIAIITIPIVAINIEIHTFRLIFSFKKRNASKAVKKGIAAKHNKVIAALVFVIDQINVIMAMPKPMPPKIPEAPILR